MMPRCLSLRPTFAPDDRVVATPATRASATGLELPDPATMTAQLAAAVKRGDNTAKQRQALMRTAQGLLHTGRAMIRQRFETEHDGLACVGDQAVLMDRLIGAMASVATREIFHLHNPTVGERLAILAVGGYGRGELAPQSDIDLLFLVPYKRAPVVEQLVETLLYALWDLGLKVGQAVRSVEECVRAAKGDFTIRTSLLETRPLWGDDTLQEELAKRLQRDVFDTDGPAFVAAKLEERDDRHARLGDSRYVLEPNIKDGKGGLRDLHTLAWIARHLYGAGPDARSLVAAGLLTPAEGRDFAKALQFQTTVRCHLHYLVNRAEERLTFDVQPEIARALSYHDRNTNSSVERFMKHYFLTAKTVGDLTRVFCAGMALEAQTRRRGIAFLPSRLVKGLGWSNAVTREVEGFEIDRGWLSVSSPDHFAAKPEDLIRVFRVAQKRQLDLHPDLLRQMRGSLKLIGKSLRENAVANAAFLDILMAKDEDPAPTLRQMNEAGVLGRFIPDFGRVVAQMQYDMYHVYTTDEHTVHAIGLLHRVETGQDEELALAGRLMGKIASRRALYLALFCHDIAKGRGGDHSVLGARVAERLGRRFAMAPEEIETAAWLVRWHLLMSDVALKRDIDDDKAVLDFATQVESPERLRLLTILTSIDIRAVGPNRWTAWKATLIGQLYDRARAMLTAGLDVESRDRRVAAVQDAVADRLRTTEGWEAPEIDRLLSLGYPSYWLAFDLDTLARQAALIRSAWRENRPLTLEHRVDRENGFTEVTIHTQDHPGLFARLSGALTLAGADILEAKVYTLASGMTVDVFLVQDAAEGGALFKPEKLARLAVTVEKCLTGSLRPAAELEKKQPPFPSRTRVFKVTPRVLIDNAASRSHTVVEINGRDRPGLLFDIARTFGRLNVQIATAKISTYGERAIDVFYIKDVFGLKITHAGKLKTIRDALTAAVEGPGA